MWDHFFMKNQRTVIYIKKIYENFSVEWSGECLTPASPPGKDLRWKLIQSWTVFTNHREDSWRGGMGFFPLAMFGHAKPGCAKLIYIFSTMAPNCMAPNCTHSWTGPNRTSSTSKCTEWCQRDVSFVIGSVIIQHLYFCKCMYEADPVKTF